MKESYKQRIIALLDCADLELLDFIFKLLEKRTAKST